MEDEGAPTQRWLPGLLNKLPRIKITGAAAPNRRASEATDVAYSIHSADELSKAIRLKTKR